MSITSPLTLITIYEKTKELSEKRTNNLNLINKIKNKLNNQSNYKMKPDYEILKKEFESLKLDFKKLDPFY